MGEQKDQNSSINNTVGSELPLSQLQTIVMKAEIISGRSAMFQSIIKLDDIDKNMLLRSLDVELNRSQVFKSG